MKPTTIAVAVVTKVLRTIFFVDAEEVVEGARIAKSSHDGSSEEGESDTLKTLDLFTRRPSLVESWRLPISSKTVSRVSADTFIFKVDKPGRLHNISQMRHFQSRIIQHRSHKV